MITRALMHDLMAGYLRTKGAQAAAMAVAALDAAAKTEESTDAIVDRLMAQIALDWSGLPAEVLALLEPFVKGAAVDGLVQLGITTGVAVDLANVRAVEWAKARAAEMVGMKYVDGALVENPRAQWAINESTRDMLRDNVTQAIEEGWSNDRLTASIVADTAFSEERAMVIARTETATADVQGNMVAYKAAAAQGIDLMKEWITANDDAVSEDCTANGEQGPIPLDDAFVSGSSAPPDHPNCRCDLLPVRFITDHQGD